jgi:GDSL-like Lipase/Acylhydrolase family
MPHTVKKQLYAFICLILITLFCIQTFSAETRKFDPRRWEKNIVKFEERDKKNVPPKDAILFTGSSSIRIWKSLKEDFPQHRVFRRGFGGCHLGDVLFYADRIVLPYKPKAIVLYVGDNDIAGGKTPQTVLYDFKKLVAKVHKELPKTRIYFLSIKRSTRREKYWPTMKIANQMIERHCRSSKLLFYIDVATPMQQADGSIKPGLLLKDELHLSRKGYKLWAKTIRPFLKDMKEAK